MHHGQTAKRQVYKNTSTSQLQGLLLYLNNGALFWFCVPDPFVAFLGAYPTQIQGLSRCLKNLFLARIVAIFCNAPSWFGNMDNRNNTCIAL